MLEHEKNDKQALQFQKMYTDKRNKAEHNNLHVGDMVLMRNDKRSNKDTPNGNRVS